MTDRRGIPSARVLFALAALGLLMIWMLLSDNWEGERTSSSGGAAVDEVLPGDQAVDSRPVHRSEVFRQPQFLDKLTRQEIPGEKIIVTVDKTAIPMAEWSLLTSEDWDQAFLQIQETQSSVSDVGFVPIAASSCRTEEEGVFLVPYSSRLHVLVGLPDEELSVVVELFLLDRQWVESYRSGAIDRGRETFLPLTSVEHMLTIYSRDHQPESQEQELPRLDLDWTELILDQNGESEMLLYFNGTCLIRAFSPESGVRYSWVEILPGQETFSQIRLEFRPLLIGQLTDEHGASVPHQPVVGIVSLGPYFEQVDWLGSREQGGVATFGQPGNYQRRFSLQSTTDSNGFFSIRLPRGEGYAINCTVGASFAFDYLMGPFSGIEETIRLTPQLKPTNLTEGVQVRVITEQGDSAAGVFVELAIADDFPWFRTLPIVQTNGEGWAGFPWIGEGTTVAQAVFLQHDRWAAPPHWRGDSVKLTPQNMPLILTIPSLHSGQPRD